MSRRRQNETSRDVTYQNLTATTHGRIYRRDPAVEPELLLVGFHGYGESAEDMMRQLEPIPGAEDWLLGAVQGLHRFYNRGSGQVVASWMTREDRLLAIDDNLAYVAAAVGRLRPDDENARGLPVVYAGFSQGTAMAYRAATALQIPCRGVIALAGDAPPEMAEMNLDNFPPVLIGWGDQDPWYDESKLAIDVDLLGEKGVECESFGFSGGHEWTDEFRTAVSRWIRTRVLSRPGEFRSG